MRLRDDAGRAVPRPTAGLRAAHANQPLIASAVTRFGAGLICDEHSADLASAAEALLHEPGLRARAQAASELLGQRLSPDAVWSELRGRVGVSRP